MRIAILQFPGSNCERETRLAVERAGMQPEEFLWNESTQKLAALDGFIIVGGFSYEDRSRAGVIAAADPIMSVLKEQSLLGKPILGICNGAQILVEAGLVPGIAHHYLSMALTDNKRVQEGHVIGTGYYNAWIQMRLSSHAQLNAFTRYLKPSDILTVPIAHAEGRFVIPPALLSEITEHGLGVFQYCDAEGQIHDEFPVNPNGSVDNIAAISNKAGNIMAMMPHPERTIAGDPIFHSMRDYIRDYMKDQTYSYSPTYLNYKPTPPQIAKYQLNSSKHQWVIEYLTTDNAALSVERALEQQNIPVKIKRFMHWEIECESEAILEKIQQSHVLFNPRKESILPLESLHLSRLSSHSSVEKYILTQTKDNIIGEEKRQTLKRHFHIEGIKEIKQGTIWGISAPSEEIVQRVIDSAMLFNPYAHQAYFWQQGEFYFA